MKAFIVLCLLVAAASTVHAGSVASCSASSFSSSTYQLCNLTLIAPTTAILTPSYSTSFAAGSGTTPFVISGVLAGTTSITVSFVPGPTALTSCTAFTGNGACSSPTLVQTQTLTTANTNTAQSVTFSSLITGLNCLAIQATAPSAFGGSNTQVVNMQVTIPAAASGDPQIFGMQGQEFQIHGTPDDVYNMVSTPSLQLNAHFVFLSEGVCDNYTACFTHPGTYIDIAAFSADNENIRVQAGSIKSGLRLFINEVEKTMSTHVHRVGSTTVSFSESRKVTIDTPELVFGVFGSDHFMNIESSIVDNALMTKGAKLVKAKPGQQVYPEVAMHGLLGQTWKNVEYTDGSSIEGTVTDYLVQDGLYGSDFTFNQYHKNL